MAINGIDPATFNPNAGREEAYNNEWQAYLTNLGQTQNKINVKKARKYFDQQFEQDWNNGAASREIDFISQKAKQNQQNLISKWRSEREAAELASQEQDAKDYEAAGYTFDFNKGWVKPTTPQQPAQQSVQQPIRDKNGRTKEEVRALQQEMLNAGYNLGKYGVDGVWGPDTQSAYDMYIQSGKKPFKEAFPESPSDDIHANNPYAGRDNRKINRNQQPKPPQTPQQTPVVNQDEPGFGDTYLGFSHWKFPWNYSDDGIIPALIKADLNNSKVALNDITKTGKDITNFLGKMLFNYTPFNKQGGKLHSHEINSVIKQILKNSNVFPYNLY